MSSANFTTSLNFSLQVAARYLWSKRSEAFISIITIISILGVAIGVMVLNVVMSVMTGFEHELRDKIVGTNSHVTVRRFSGCMSPSNQGSKLFSALRKCVKGHQACCNK